MLKGIDEKGPLKDKKVEGVEQEGHTEEKKDGIEDGRSKKKSSDTEKSGRLLVILDNVWKKVNLNLLGIQNELEKDLGCKIIVISRSEDVCKEMDASDIFQVGDLDDKEAERLFKERVGDKADHKDYKEISGKLLKKCSRLPLTINVLANRLKNQTISVWEQILKQLEMPVHGETLGVLGDTYSIIEMSYNYLGNDEKKMFFLLCCLFPPGSSVYIDDLLKYGIGMGLFQYVDTIVEAIEQAYKWAEDLKSLSLLTEVDVKKGVIHIHDDVREAGKTFAAKREQSFHVGAIPRWLKKDSYGKYSVISMMSSSSYEYLADRKLPNLQLLRSLGLSCSNLCEHYFRGMQNLKVLDMSKSEIESLPSSFEKLENLETLLLEYCSLKDISQVSNLVKLQVLSFRKSNIMRLPKEMEALVELKLLDLTNCSQLEDIPSGIFSHLKQLEALYMRHSFSNWTMSGSMASLSELTSLPLKVLEITIQNISQLPDGDFPVVKLSSYKIDLAVQTPPQQEQLSSRDLQLGVVHARDLIKERWRPLMNGAESLCLNDIEGLKNIAPYLGEDGWQELKRITVSECPEIDCIISGKAMYQSVIFPKLEMLKLEHLSALEAIYHGTPPPDFFSNLQELSLSYLNRLRSSAVSIQHVARLKVLEVKNCENLKSIFFAPISIQRGSGVAKSGREIQLPCLKRLVLANLEALQGLFEVTNSDDQNRLIFPKQVVFPVLDKIIMQRLDEIEQLWDIATGKEFSTTFPKLRSISLKEMNQLRSVWCAELFKTKFSFEKLKKLKIVSCETLQFVCPPSVAQGFQELELLRIFNCEKLKEVITTEGSKAELDVIMKSEKQLIINFPKLLTIDFLELPELIYLYQGRAKVGFPGLKKLKLNTLLKLKTLTKMEPQKSMKASKKNDMNPKDEGILFGREVKFLSLETLYAESLDSIEGIWDIKINQFSVMYPNLQSLTLRYMQVLKLVWTKELTGATRISINVKEIEIESCNSMKSLFPSSTASSNEIKLEFPELQSIKVESSNKFKYILEGNMNMEFPSLKTIGLSDLDEMVTFAKLKKPETPRSREDDEASHDTSVPLFNGKIYIPDLEELQVNMLPNIKKIWGIISSDEFSQIFARLHSLVIQNMRNLKHIWSDDPTNESHYYFRNLEKMEIMDCDEIESLFSCSIGTSSTMPPQVQRQKVVSFPKMQSLLLKSLESFKCLFRGYSNMELRLENMFVVESIYHGKSPLDLFSNLQELSLSYLNQLRSSAIAIQHTTRLRILEVKNCSNLKSIFFAPSFMKRGRGQAKTGHEIRFPYLEKLILANLEALQGIFEVTNSKNHKRLVFPTQVVFPVLDKIKLKRLQEIEQLWGIATGKEFAISFPELRSISLKYMNQVKSVWGDELCKTSFSFEKLKKLKIRSCDSLEYVCPPLVAMGFGELELLRIVSCDKLTQVITTEGGGDEFDTIMSSKKKMVINFPKLLIIELIVLPELTYFYQGHMKVEFLVLKHLRLDTLLKLQTLTKMEPQKSTEENKEKENNPKDEGILFGKEVQFPSLEELYVESLDSIEGMWDVKTSQFSMMYPKLKILTLRYMEVLKLVWNKGLTCAAQISINLKEIEIESCNSLESLFPSSTASNNEIKVEFSELKSFKVESSDKFKYILEGNVNMEFPALKTIELSDLDEMVAFAKLKILETPSSIENDEVDHDSSISLFNEKIYIPFLEELQVEKLPNIHKLWGMISSDEFSPTFAKLQSLVIKNMHKLKHVWSDDPEDESHYYFESLKTMEIMNCDTIESLFSGSTVTTDTPHFEVQSQKVISFPKMQSLVLKDLDIFRCLFRGYSNMKFQALKELVINRLPLVKTLVKLQKCDVVDADDEEDDGDDEDKEKEEEEKEEEKKEEEDKVENEIKEEEDKVENEIKEEEEIKENESVQEEGSNVEEEPKRDDTGVLFEGNVEFSSLEELKIKYMPELESIYTTTKENDVAYSSIFPKLKTLHLTGGTEVKLKQLPATMLHKLSSLVICKYNELKYLVSSSGEEGGALLKSLPELVNLKELIIKECESLEELFGVEGQDVTIKLFSLEKLVIAGLPKLKCVQWRILPNLRTLEVYESLEGTRFLVPTTEVVVVGGSSVLQSLECLEMAYCDGLEAIIGDEKNDKFVPNKDDHEIRFPKLKEIDFRRMRSLITFNSTSIPTHLPSLTSVTVNRCDLVRSFGPLVISQLSNLEIDYDTIVLDGGELNTILQHQFDENHPIPKHWPQKVKCKLHEGHQLSLLNRGSYICNGCQKEGGAYTRTISYTCEDCGFHLHPRCALDESQLSEEPVEMKVRKDLPGIVKHESHVEHELKLVPGLLYNCNGCGQSSEEVFVYHCDECNFDLHPKCAVEMLSPELGP